MVYASCFESSRISDPGTVGSNPTVSASFNARVAQLAEQETFNLEVPGSSPGARTNNLECRITNQFDIQTF